MHFKAIKFINANVAGRWNKFIYQGSAPTAFLQYRAIATLFERRIFRKMIPQADTLSHSFGRPKIIGGETRPIWGGGEILLSQTFDDI
ncbi:hypothetical protein C7W93_03205 [Glaciimonas sp. PCH181]|nr:hypothetical protein C7W93_03205 [Glaciimonas sp. PCH181]